MGNCCTNKPKAVVAPVMEIATNLRMNSKISVRSQTYNSSITQEERRDLTPEHLRERVPLLRIATSPLYRRRRTRARPTRTLSRLDSDTISNSVTL